MNTYKLLVLVLVLSSYFAAFCSPNLNAGSVKDLIPSADELNPFFISEDPEYYLPENLLK